MNKRRLTLVVLALLTALLLVSPVIAETTLGNVDVEKPPEETETLAACGHDHGSEVTLQETVSETETVYNYMKVGNLIFVETKYGEWVVPACTHTKTITYFDTDTNESGHICAKCGYTKEYGDYHDYRCDNYIPGFYDCSYAQVEDQPCTWSIWYYSAAVNGVHTEHRECVLCGIWGVYEEYPCSIDTGYCYYCNQVNH